MVKYAFTLVLLLFWLTSKSQEPQRDLNPETNDELSLALYYAPKVYTDSAYSSPKLSTVHFEIDTTESAYLIRYHLEWEDEVVPAPYLDFLYRVKRRVKYGKSFVDVEYVQVNVDKVSKRIQKCIFETKEPHKTHQDNFQKHLTCEIINSERGYTLNFYEKDNNKTLVGSKEFIGSLGNNINLLSVTWNHLLAVLAEKDNNLYQWKYQLKALTREEYVSKKYDTRSQKYYR